MADQWEYKITNFLTEEEMNKLGDQGWELVGTAPFTATSMLLYFKRRKPYRLTRRALTLGVRTVADRADNLLDNHRAIPSWELFLRRDGFLVSPVNSTAVGLGFVLLFHRF